MKSVPWSHLREETCRQTKGTQRRQRWCKCGWNVGRRGGNLRVEICWSPGSCTLSHSCQNTLWAAPDLREIFGLLLALGGFLFISVSVFISSLLKSACIHRGFEGAFCDRDFNKITHSNKDWKVIVNIRIRTAIILWLFWVSTCQNGGENLNQKFGEFSKF